MVKCKFKRFSDNLVEYFGGNICQPHFICETLKAIKGLKFSFENHKTCMKL